MKQLDGSRAKTPSPRLQPPGGKPEMREINSNLHHRQGQVNTRKAMKTVARVVRWEQREIVKQRGYYLSKDNSANVGNEVKMKSNAFFQLPSPREGTDLSNKKAVKAGLREGPARSSLAP